MLTKIFNPTKNTTIVIPNIIRMIRKQKHVLKKPPTLLKIPVFQKVRTFKNLSFNTKFHFSQKIPPISKIPRSKKVRTFKNSSFNTKFRVFQKLPCFLKIPRLKKVRTFEKVAFFNKIRFIDMNICFSRMLYGTFVILYPHNFKTCRIHAF